MATMRDIKRRKSSIESTEQITKAMKLVATVKLQKSRTKAENSRLYFNLMYQTIQEMLKKSTRIRHRYLKSGDSKKKAVIVVSSNRGLAGGYNSNIIRLVTESGIPKEDALIFAIGRKGRDGLARKGYEIKADYSDVIDEPLYSDAQQISKELLAMFEKNEIGEIYLAYTAFKNTVSQIPTFLKLLPVDLAAAGPKGEVKEEKPDLLIMNYEPDEDEVLDAIIPKYVSSLIYGAFLEAVASENGARMTAMDSATNNAEGDDRKTVAAVQPCTSGIHHSGVDRDHRGRECHRWLKRNMSNYLADLHTCGAGGNRQHTGDRNQSA